MRLRQDVHRGGSERSVGKMKETENLEGVGAERIELGIPRVN